MEPRPVAPSTHFSLRYTTNPSHQSQLVRQMLCHWSRFSWRRYITNKSNSCILFVNTWLSVLFANYCTWSETFQHTLVQPLLPEPSVWVERLLQASVFVVWEVYRSSEPLVLQAQIRGDIALTVWGFLISSMNVEISGGFEIVNPSKTSHLQCGEVSPSGDLTDYLIRRDEWDLLWKRCVFTHA